MKPISISYFFRIPKGSQEMFCLRINPETLELMNRPVGMLPVWAKLQFHQCPNCPLDSKTSPDCPLAAHMVPIARQFKDVVSYDSINVEVTTQERFISQTTSAQTVLSSLMGLIIATCGCPHTAFFRPMARFHLPLATEEETLYRATSMYLLAQYFRAREGFAPDLELKGLHDIYANVGIVNRAIAHRIRVAGKSDSTINALVLLDVFTMALPFAIEDALKDLRYLFASYLPKSPAAPCPEAGALS
jgi:hypothetical protein